MSPAHQTVLYSKFSCGPQESPTLLSAVQRQCPRVLNEGPVLQINKEESRGNMPKGDRTAIPYTLDSSSLTCRLVVIDPASFLPSEQQI